MKLPRTRSAIPQPNLLAALWDVVDAIPEGHVASYGQLAAALGDATAARWVATELLHHEPRGSWCPCLRVVRKTGDVGQFAHGTPRDKADRLSAEGLRVSGSAVAGPWARLVERAGGPFEEMAAWQQTVAARRLRPIRQLPDTVAGLDVSYAKDGRAVVACVVIDRHVRERRAGKVLWQKCVVVEPEVPYVSGYLVFRELPALVAAYHAAVKSDAWPGLAVIDGSGRLHPRRAGIATCFAIVTGQPTIGVTKKRLLGNFNEQQLTHQAAQPIVVDGERVGTAMQSPTGGKPVFVSPGEGISQFDADEVIAPTLSIHRVPEPIYWADRISREAAAKLS